MLTHILNEQELLALLNLPFFQQPNQLSPFFALQESGEAVGANAEVGFSLLHDKELWEPVAQELSLEGRQVFVPVFAPNARIMLFRGATARAPTQEFYVFKSYIVQYEETLSGGFLFRGPYKEHELVDHFRKIFPDRRTPHTEHELSLFEQEFICLWILCKQVEEGISANAETIRKEIEKRLDDDDLAFPVVGFVDLSFPESPRLEKEDIMLVLEHLLGDGLLERSPSGGYQAAQIIGELFEKISTENEFYMIREESDDNELLVREVSIFNSRPGYFLGRCSYNEQFNTRVVHLEDMEWHTLYRLINEITRKKDYLVQLTLEVRRRSHAHVRG